MSRALKQNDVLELSKLYEAEFNRPDLHDRVLVFDVVGKASWQHVFNVKNERSGSEASAQSEDESEYESPVQTVRVGMNAERSELIPVLKQVAKPEKISEALETPDSERNEKESESHDDEFTSNGEDSQGNDDEASDKIEGEQIKKATEANENADIAFNENMETNQNESNENETKSQHDCKVEKYSNDENPTTNNEEQSGNSSETKSNEASHRNSKEEIIRQHKFYIHSSWLAVQSSYFRFLFFGGMKESSASEVHIQISESEEQAHLMLLEAMYTIDVLDVASSVDELLEVLRLSHKYDVKFVFKKAKYCLQAAVVSLDICEKIVRFIKMYNIITGVEDLVDTLQSFLAKEFSPLDKTWQTTSFRKLCETSLRYLLSSDELVAASENTVFHSLMYWIEQRGIENVSESDGMPSLLSVVRFELMSIDYLYNIVQHNSVAKKLPDFNDQYLRGVSYHAVSDSIKQRLLCQPVKRKASAEFFIPYTWVIRRDKLDNLVGTEQELVSNAFWYCGYEMGLEISDVVKVNDLGGNQAIFTATLCLGIFNLTQQSEVMIQWQPTSQSFTSTPPERKYTFDEKPDISSVGIKYKMEVQQENANSNEASRPSFISNSGFNLLLANNTNTLGASKSSSVSEQERPMSSLSISVKIKLV
jgi:hypothetical protein